MKIAYMILAHNTPNHLSRLVSALSSKNATFFIHIDKKSEISEYISLKDRENVIFLDNRIPVYWGDFSTVEAEINLIKSALNHSEKFDRYVLMTGSDYPIQSRDCIEEFFIQNPKSEYMNIVKMPSETKPLSRLTEYNFIPCYIRIPKKIKRAIVKIISLFYKRDYEAPLKGMTPYAGSQTWAITAPAAEFIIDFCSKNKIFLNFYRYAYAPDESFFQTILGNSPFKHQILRALTYAEWGKGMSSPYNVDEGIIKKIISNPIFPSGELYGQGKILFARKFTDNSKHLTDIVDSYLLAYRDLH